MKFLPGGKRRGIRTGWAGRSGRLGTRRGAPVPAPANLQIRFRFPCGYSSGRTPPPSNVPITIPGTSPKRDCSLALAAARRDAMVRSGTPSEAAISRLVYPCKCLKTIAADCLGGRARSSLSRSGPIEGSLGSGSCGTPSRRMSAPTSRIRSRRRYEMATLIAIRCSHRTALRARPAGPIEGSSAPLHEAGDRGWTGRRELPKPRLPERTRGRSTGRHADLAQTRFRLPAASRPARQPGQSRQAPRPPPRWPRGWFRDPAPRLPG